MKNDLFECPDCGLGVTELFHDLNKCCPNCRMDIKNFVRALPKPGKTYWTEEVKAPYKPIPRDESGKIAGEPTQKTTPMWDQKKTMIVNLMAKAGHPLSDSQELLLAGHLCAMENPL